MKRLLMFLLLMALPAVAQNFMTITASHVQTGSGTVLPSGTILFQGTDNKGKQISYQAGGSGQVITYPVSCTITQGVINSPCQLANVDLTNPINVCFNTTVKDSMNHVVLGGNNSGYECVQPQTANAWCAAGTCNFDSYVPTSSHVPIAVLRPPTATTLGGIYALQCTDPIGQKQVGTDANGRPVCGTDQGGTGGTIAYGPSFPAQANTYTYFTLTPPAASPGLYQCSNTNAGGCTADNQWTLIGPGNNNAQWGNIGGSITNQADLQAALNGKLNTSLFVWGNIPGILANQTDLQTALNNKANSAALAAVAFSGNYNDLSNKPKIPGSVVPFGIEWEFPTTADSGKFLYPGYPVPVTLTQLACNADNGVVSVNIEIRSATDWNAAGTPALTIPIQCNNIPVSTSSFAVANVAANAPLAIEVPAVSGTPTMVRIRGYFQIQ